jgi:hypothetical protein
MTIFKFIFIYVSLNIFVFASGHEIQLEEFDQSHLSNLISSLPNEIIDTSKEYIQAPIEGVRVLSSFTPYDIGIKIDCWSEYFDRSAWPSFSGCKLFIDSDHPTVEIKNDQAKIEVRNSTIASSFYEAIPYGRPNKVFYSFNKIIGTNFYGREDVNIFDFFLNCNMDSCEFFFKHKK